MSSLSTNEHDELTGIIADYLESHEINCPDNDDSFQLISDHVSEIIEELESQS